MKERYEQEIEQLLNELESDPAKPATPPAANQPTTPLDDQPSPFAPRPRRATLPISPAKLALIGGVLAVVGLLAPIPLLRSLSLVGLAVLVVAVVWMFISRARSQPSAYWRGRPVDEPPQGVWDRFRRWLSR